MLVLLSSLWLNWFLWGHSEKKKKPSVILVLRRGEERFLCLIVEKRLNDLFCKHVMQFVAVVPLTSLRIFVRGPLVPQRVLRERSGGGSGGGFEEALRCLLPSLC